MIISEFGESLEDLDTKAATALVGALKRAHYAVDCRENPGVLMVNECLGRARTQNPSP